MTDINRSNCKKLAAYLDTLPDNYANFDMGAFFVPTDMVRMEQHLQGNAPLHECGTVACAIGHGPAAGIPFPEDNSFWYTRTEAFVVDPDDPDTEYLVRGNFNIPDWSVYSYRFFIDGHSTWWDWCFGGGWNLADDTPKGAAARIRMMLDYTKKGKSLPWDPDRREFRAHRLYKASVRKFYLALYQ